MQSLRMTRFFSRVKRGLHASVVRPRRAKIFRGIPRALGATRAPASSAHSAVDATAAGVAAGRIAEAVNAEDVRDSNAAALADLGMTGATRAATQVLLGALS